MLIKFLDNILSILILLTVNIFADIGLVYWICLLTKIILEANGHDISIYITISNWLENIAPFRFFILPFAYKLIEKSQGLNLAKQFILLLKKSVKIKILILLITFVYFPPLLEFYPERIYEQVMFTIIRMGLCGSYIVLFFYWWVEDLIKSRKKQKEKV